MIKTSHSFLTHKQTTKCYPFFLIFIFKIVLWPCLHHTFLKLSYIILFPFVRYRWYLSVPGSWSKAFLNGLTTDTCSSSITAASSSIIVPAWPDQTNSSNKYYNDHGQQSPPKPQRVPSAFMKAVPLTAAAPKKLKHPVCSIISFTLSPKKCKLSRSRGSATSTALFQ